MPAGDDTPQGHKPTQINFKIKHQGIKVLISLKNKHNATTHNRSSIPSSRLNLEAWFQKRWTRERTRLMLRVFARETIFHASLVT